jgi:hypothetical protein
MRREGGALSGLLRGHVQWLAGKMTSGTSLFPKLLGAGVNDNGSCVAALLKISRMLQTVEPPLTVRFVAFVPLFFSTRGPRAVHLESGRRPWRPASRR